MQGASGDDLMRSLHLVSGFRVHTSVFLSIPTLSLLCMHTDTHTVGVSKCAAVRDFVYLLSCSLFYLVNMWIGICIIYSYVLFCIGVLWYWLSIPYIVNCQVILSHLVGHVSHHPGHYAQSLGTWLSAIYAERFFLWVPFVSGERDAWWERRRLDFVDISTTICRTSDVEPCYVTMNSAEL